MAKLPARQKVTLLCFRRAEPDEVLLVQREVRGSLHWALPYEEVEDGEPPRAAALRLAARLVPGEPIADLPLGLEARYRVGDGPRAGEWTESYHAVEAPPQRRPREGVWLAHYEAKARAGADAPRVRDAFTQLRERARLKP